MCSLRCFVVSQTPINAIQRIQMLYNFILMQATSTCCYAFYFWATVTDRLFFWSNTICLNRPTMLMPSQVSIDHCLYSVTCFASFCWLDPKSSVSKPEKLCAVFRNSLPVPSDIYHCTAKFASRSSRRDTLNNHVSCPMPQHSGIRMLRQTRLPRVSLPPDLLANLAVEW